MDVATFLALLAAAISFWYNGLRRIRFFKENPKCEESASAFVTVIVAMLFVAAVICAFVVD